MIDSNRNANNSVDRYNSTRADAGRVEGHTGSDPKTEKPVDTDELTELLSGDQLYQQRARRNEFIYKNDRGGAMKQAENYR